MSDFAQAGLITTLQRLNERHLSIIQTELAELARERPIGLVLPCHATDLANPALAAIAHELSKGRFLAEIVLSINGSEPRDLPGWAEGMTVLWNEPHASNTERRAGKGENVAAAFRHLAGNTPCIIFATQDCDVVSFRCEDLARLCYSVAHPGLPFRFAKMYHSRATDRLYGRVSRLFLAPLLSAIERVAGRMRLLDFLRSFRYPLAGEIALTRELAMALPAKTGWALELGLLCELPRRIDPREVCDVEGGVAYDHKHQPAHPALTQMATEIAAELLSQLVADGLNDTAEFRVGILAAYRTETELVIHRSASLAVMNALPFDEREERALVESFIGQLARLPLAERTTK